MHRNKNTQHTHLVHLPGLTIAPPPNGRVGRQLLDDIRQLPRNASLCALVSLIAGLAGVDLHRLKPGLAAHDVCRARLADAWRPRQQHGFLHHVFGLGARRLALGFGRGTPMQMHALPVTHNDAVWHPIGNVSVMQVLKQARTSRRATFARWQPGNCCRPALPRRWVCTSQPTADHRWRGGRRRAGGGGGAPGRGHLLRKALPGWEPPPQGPGPQGPGLQGPGQTARMLG